MADQQRGRSPSAGHQNHLRHTPSPSPHNGFRQQPQGLGVDQHLTNDATFANSFTDPAFGAQNAFDPNEFLNTSQPPQDAFAAQSDIAQHTFLQAHSAPHSGRQSPSINNTQTTNDFTSDFLDPSAGANTNFNEQFFATNSSLEQEFLDPQLLGGEGQNDASVDPTNLMNTMATQQSPTPPHMLQGGMDRRSVSPHISPNLNQGPFPAPRHSRNASLDPSSAAFPQGLSAGWGEGNQFQGHRRTTSDAHSDVSSAFTSPYLAGADSFDQQPGADHHSPLLGAQQDPVMFSNIGGFENINLSDGSLHQQQRRVSPSPSPRISPQIVPQQQHLPAFTSADNFGLSAGSLQNQFLGQNAGGAMFQGQEAFPSLGHGGNGLDIAGQASAMSPPEINIQPAPPSRQQSFEPSKDDSQDALSPPERSRSRNQNRMRAISDPYNGRRSASPANGHVRNSLSPNSARTISRTTSRSPSPSSRAGTGNRRSSTSSVPNRDYILDLADPQRPHSDGGTGDSSSPGRQRTQKHPATFQCSLCPKRFTRAYNLRSHLRTHTDERPFVCSVCGKAFARQHDRKRHEGLHSGEKRFVCRGHLKTGDNWGCGRKFARADALGRHFRSEAGRVCIKPLLEEEAAEKGSWDAASAQNDAAQQAQQQNLTGGMVGQPGMMLPGQPMGAMGFQLPQVLYQQFPMLQGMNWDALPAGDPDVDDISGRSSFDASSGGEMEDFDDGVYGGGIGAQGWASDTGAY